MHHFRLLTLSLAIVAAPVLGSGGATRGLASPDLSTGQIFMLTWRDQTALDRVLGEAQANGRFSWELAQTLQTAGIEIGAALEQVKDRVEDKTRRAGHEQHPNLVNDLRGSLYLLPGSGVEVAGLKSEPEPMAPLARPAQAGGLRLEDLEKEEASRKEWAARQARMKVDFVKTARFKGRNDLQTKAWIRFLGAWPQDNPLSGADEELRAQAQSRLKAARQAAQAEPVPAAAAQPTRPSAIAGKTIKDCTECPELVVLPEGSFRMGAPESEIARFINEVPAHEVRIGYRLAMGKHEVTRGEFGQFVAATGYKTVAERDGGCVAWNGEAWEYNVERNWRSPGFKQTDRHPVVCVSWDDAQMYLEWLNGKNPGKGYRLPSEAEWEYAARAGSSTAYPWGAAVGSNNANCWGCGSRWDAKGTAPVAQFRANGFGLHDMQGNAWEVLQDLYHDSYSGAPTDGSAWSHGGDQWKRVARGGSWHFNPFSLRSAYRSARAPDVRGSGTGFRIARTF